MTSRSAGEAADRRVTVAVDLLGGDHAPEAVVDGALLAVEATPSTDVVLVGPPDLAERLLAERGAAGRFEVAAASQVVAMDEDPVRAVRARRDATVRVAATLVRDGGAHATVSVGNSGAVVAAALFTLGMLPGVTRPGLAVVVPSAAGPVVLLDAGATVDPGVDLLAQLALVGSAYARVRLGLDAPRVGLLTIGSEPGKGDALRKAAYDALTDLPIDFVGNVEGHDVVLGGPADVVVTDGFTGNVLLKGIEGTLAMCSQSGIAGRAGSDRAGAVLLGVDGITVIGHGASSPQDVAGCIELAATVARHDLVERTREVMGDLIGRRRAAAGLPATLGGAS